MSINRLPGVGSMTVPVMPVICGCDGDGVVEARCIWKGKVVVLYYFYCCCLHRFI